MKAKTEIQSDVDINGYCDPVFQPVAGAFACNLAETEEVEVSVRVTVDGRTVVDLSGGIRDPNSGALWQRDTAFVVFFRTRAATALYAQILVDRGLFDLNAPVSHCCLEFAVGGKEWATVAMMLDHIAIAMKLVGVLLITALLIIPAATAWRFGSGPVQMAVIASIIGAGAVVAGIFGSQQSDTPSGPSIVVAALVLFLRSLMPICSNALRRNVARNARNLTA